MAAPSKRERVFLKAAYDGDLKLVERLASELKDGKGLTKDFEAVTDEEGINALHWAAAAGRTQLCRFLIKKLKFNVVATDHKGNTPLVVAIVKRHYLTAVYLIEDGAAAIDCINIWGETALRLIVHLGHKEIVRLLLSKGAKVNHDRMITPNSPLQVACHFGNKEIVKLLLDKGADPNSSWKLSSPLITSVNAKSYKCMKLLLKAGADPNISVAGRTPLQFAVLHPDGLRMVKLLLGAGANANVLDPMMLVTPLEMAALRGDVTEVKTLLPFTSRIPSIPDWSVDGIMKHCCSDEVSIEVFNKKKNQLELSKAKAREAFEKKDYNDALSWYYQASLNDREDAELVSMRNLCWKELNQPKRALDDAKICVEMKPDWAEAHYRLGAAWMVLKEYAEAFKAFRQALRLDPTNKDFEKAKRKALEAELGSSMSEIFRGLFLDTY